MADRGGFERGCRFGYGMVFGTVAAAILLPILIYLAIGVFGIFVTPPETQQNQNSSPSQTK